VAGIYIHIPFCKQACNYCNFYFSVSTNLKERFVAALLKEIALTTNYLETKTLHTLYIGGGTPSLLSADELKTIIDTLSKHYDLSHLQEFTLEANPDDLTEAKVKELSELKAYGLNRFSIGVQSFAQADLIYMNRAHNADEALSSIKRVQHAGFENLTIDLIYGTPTMNDELWYENLIIATRLGIPHISSYALTVEPKTNLDQKIRKGKALPVNEAQSAGQFAILIDQMKQQGFEQYEISNFARNGMYAVHNTNYWLGKKYLGLGPSAHSYNKVSRQWNVANNLNYINVLEQSTLSFEEEILTPEQIVNEQIMTGLRTMWGFNLNNADTNMQREIIASLKTIDPAHYKLEGNILTLTDKGKFFADAIAAELFVEVD
jgi:oxygen-independent coproporphyrinogen III oxidase